jgi:undecaprenyl-diphosphatase
MPIWFAILMGVVQGLTEFLPISSTAHLRIAPTLLGQPDPGTAFTAVLQLGTLLAVMIYFAKDLFVTLPRAMIKEPRSPAGRLPWLLVAGSVPIVVGGLLLEDHIEGPFRSLWVVAGTLIGVGVVMGVIDARKNGVRGALDANLRDALLIGLAQACALVPGVSRSGSTICMALLLGMSRTEAARFSFLLGIPAIAGAGVLELKDALDTPGIDVTALVVGTVTSAITGYLSIAWLLKFLGSKRLLPFAVYRVALGIVLIGLVAGGVVLADAGT